MSKETKHTPTPWFAATYVVADKDGNIANTYNDKLPDEGCANAAFIVRACNSHEALVEALKAIVAALSQPVQARIERTEDRAVRALEIVHGDCQFAVRTAQEALAQASSPEQK